MLSCHNGCQSLQDMKAKHEKETNLKAERDVMAKDAADKEAAAQVKHCCTRQYSIIGHRNLHRSLLALACVIPA